MKIPEILLDAEGYPTDEYLQFLAEYTPDWELTTLDFIRLIQRGWWHGESLIIVGGRYRDVVKVEMHTGGWSGNEQIISALLDNKMLLVLHMRYTAWKAGGHYYFEVKV